MPISTPYLHEFLCTGTVNGDGQVAPVYAKVLAASLLLKNKTNMNTYTLTPRCPWPAGCLLGAAWGLPGCLLDAHWVFTAPEYMFS